MSRNTYGTEDDLTPEERRLLQEMSGTDTWGSWGGLIGAGAGAAGGLIAAPFTGGASLAAIPGLMGVGSMAGQAIGGGIGGNERNRLEDRLHRLRQQRMRPGLESEARLRAFQNLLGKYSSF